MGAELYRNLLFKNNGYERKKCCRTGIDILDGEKSWQGENESPDVRGAHNVRFVEKMLSFEKAEKGEQANQSLGQTT